MGRGRVGGHHPGAGGKVAAQCGDRRHALFVVCEVRGKAWSGTGPVTKVDVRMTGEGEWHAAKLESPTSPYQWQDWSFDWQATTVGRHTLRARATGAAGNVQPDVPPWNRLGYGNNASEVRYVH
jgi:hypothetical protein